MLPLLRRPLSQAALTHSTTTHSLPAWAAARLFSVSIKASDAAEKDVAAKLAASLPGSRRIEVEDVSGGCGAMYRIEVEASDFKGLSIVKQHQAVAAILKEDIGKWHGMRLTTKASEPVA